MTNGFQKQFLKKVHERRVIEGELNKLASFYNRYPSVYNTKS